MPKVKASKVKSSAIAMDESDGAPRSKPKVSTSGASAAPSAASGLWEEEVAAADAAAKRAEIEAAISKASSAREKRKLRLQLTMKAHEEKANLTKISALAGSAASADRTKPKSAPAISPFAELLSALPSAAPPAALSRPETALAAVTSAFTVRTGKVSRAKPDVAAVAQFTAIAGLPSFATNPLKLLQQQIKSNTRKAK